MCKGCPYGGDFTHEGERHSFCALNMEEVGLDGETAGLMFLGPVEPPCPEMDRMHEEAKAWNEEVIWL